MHAAPRATARLPLHLAAVVLLMINVQFCRFNEDIVSTYLQVRWQRQNNLLARWLWIPCCYVCLFMHNVHFQIDDHIKLYASALLFHEF